MVATERPLPDLIPKIDDFTKLAYFRGAQVIFRCDSTAYELLKFLDCLHTLISKLVYEPGSQNCPSGTTQGDKG